MNNAKYTKENVILTTIKLNKYERNIADIIMTLSMN
jgi:hypothetical protein